MRQHFSLSPATLWKVQSGLGQFGDKVQTVEHQSLSLSYGYRGPTGSTSKYTCGSQTLVARNFDGGGTKGGKYNRLRSGSVVLPEEHHASPRREEVEEAPKQNYLKKRTGEYPTFVADENIIGPSGGFTSIVSRISAGG